MKKLLTIILAGGLLAGAVGSAQAKAKTTVVMEDVAGDAGNAEQGQAIPGFDAAGLDLVGGSISTVGKNVKFTVTTAALSPNGSFMPETVRLLWHINSGGEEYRFTVKSFDIGKPDVIAGGVGQERIGKVYANGVVRLEQCTEVPAGITLVQCVTSVYTEPKFDAATKSFSWEIPLAAIKAKKGTLIAGGTSGAAATSCQVCFVPHYAERSLTPTTVIDSGTVSGTHKV